MILYELINDAQRELPYRRMQELAGDKASKMKFIKVCYLLDTSILFACFLCSMCRKPFVEILCDI